MVIKVKSLSVGADTNQQGELLFKMMKSALTKGGSVVVDFDGIENATSSFVNSSFVNLLDFFTFSQIQKRVQIVGANRQIANLIRSRMHYEAA